MGVDICFLHELLPYAVWIPHAGFGFDNAANAIGAAAILTIKPHTDCRHRIERTHHWIRHLECEEFLV